MTRLQILRALFQILLILDVVKAFIIDDTCASIDRQNIISAVDEALSIAEYAGWRIVADRNTLDPFLKQVLGDNADAGDVYTKRMTSLADVAGPLTAAPFKGPSDRGLDQHVLFRCGDRAAQQSTKKSDKWYDRDFKNRFPLLRYTATNPTNIPVCAPGILAMTANTKQPDGKPVEQMPHHIIYLCDNALKQQPTMGTEWKSIMWTGIPVEQTAKYLSGTIVHELLHAQVADDKKPDLLGALPSRATEKYKFSEIISLSNDDKIANTHGYTLLATTSYIKKYQIGTSGEMGDAFMPGDEPGESPNDGHQQ
ncbi:Hypothetical protein D9617_4g001790 [Elsinoe fawcettii]|nr:Hypothetical protein D9617_4g001790 [Elsinoe fawcettii]